MNAHTPKTQMGMGDYYGTGIKNKVGRMREDSIGHNPVSSRGMKRSPRSLA